MPSLARVTRKRDAEYGDSTKATRETRGRKSGQRPLADIQAETLSLLAEGLSVKQVMAKVDRTPQTYQLWRKNTPGYANKVDRIRAKMKGETTLDPGNFSNFRKKYLGMDTFRHQYQWIDLLEGRDPRDLHESQVYTPGGDGKRRILINTPPDHGKSTTITVDYVTYRICKDPSVRVIIISASEDMARKFLLSIKERLTHAKYAQIAADFGPEATGFVDPHVPWDAKKIYVAGRDPEQKDPTVEALGINGTIYGSRADLIILDDCVTGKTARTKGMREKTLRFIRQEVASRLHPATGRMLMVGTRLASDDLYGEIVKQDETRGVWTYLTQPAILEYGETPDKHRTLWPERIDGSFLNSMMLEYGDEQGDFKLVYMQQSQPGDATFPEPAVRECIYPGGCGRVPDWVRPGGMLGLYVVGGVDPAAAGHTAFVVVGVDKRTKQRYLIDCLNIRSMKPHIMREKMIEWTKTYSVNEWRIEKNGLQTLLSQDRDLRLALLGLGARIYEHHTLEYGHSGKWDPDFGVASMAPLFLGALEQPKSNLITMPFNGTHRATRELIDQLISWEPQSVGKTDLVMALWFAELGARKQLQVGHATHASNRWATKGRQADRRVINIQDWMDVPRHAAV